MFRNATTRIVFDPPFSVSITDEAGDQVTLEALEDRLGFAFGSLATGLRRSSRSMV